MLMLHVVNVGIVNMLISVSYQKRKGFMWAPIVSNYYLNQLTLKKGVSLQRRIKFIVTIGHFTTQLYSCKGSFIHVVSLRKKWLKISNNILLIMTYFVKSIFSTKSSRQIHHRPLLYLRVLCSAHTCAMTFPLRGT